MRMSLSPQLLGTYVLDLVCHHFPDGYRPAYALAPLLERTLQRVEHCFSYIHRKYYREGDEVLFDHLNGDHFASFLYFLGNTIWRETQDTELPTRLFYLNKVMHGLDLFYSVTMPDIFLLVHPLGSVLGNARYGDYFVVYQNVTVGSDEAGIYPSFGSGTVLYAKSTVIGACTFGNDVVLAANTFILNTNVPTGSLVIGQYPVHRIIPSAITVARRVFDGGMSGTHHG
jgi:serine O-acetyltransferase